MEFLTPEVDGQEFHVEMLTPEVVCQEFHVEMLTPEVDGQEFPVENLTPEVDGQEFHVEFYPRGSIGKNSMWDFYPRGSIGKNSMWKFYLGGLRVKKRWPFSAEQGRASKNNLFQEACARGVGEGKRENRFIGMGIVPVSNEPIGVAAVPEHVFGRQFEWFMLSSASPHRRRSRQRP